MIALDTSSLVAYLAGDAGSDVDAIEVALAEHQACLPPAVLAELLSDPRLPAATAALFKQLPALPISEGYWERVGALRAEVIAKGRKARLADALIAQSCVDHSVTLVTRDPDFDNFAAVRDMELLLFRPRPAR
jgi:predicted nucleic acid-binding protein